ncbi:MAG: hypothetical protein IIB55_09030, partial [Planctomycetes bacterium]|nr:hypothetical protein [Planctomycetota bacterium]
TDHHLDTRACLFHIGSPRVDEVRAMTQRLAELPVRVRDCANVYQGLARLCIADSDKPSALVVSVDVMDAAELEFFRIVARLFPSLLVYVYGGARSCARVDRAIELGARDRASDEVLIELIRLRVSPAKPTDGPAVVEVAEPPEASTEALRETPRDALLDPLPDVAPDRHGDPPLDPPDAAMQEDDDPVVEEDVTEEEVAEDEVTEVRVPWLTYKDAPARRAPDPPPHVSPPAIAAMPEKRAVRVSEPLLSQEELRALLDGDGLPLPDAPNGSTKEASS